MRVQPTFRPQVESLESRELLAAPQASVLNGVLVVNGTSGNDYLSVTQAAGKISVYGAPITVGTSQAAAVDATLISKVVINGYAGDDTIIGNTLSKDMYVDAGMGNDAIYAGLGSDYLDAGAGNDLIYGGAGNDRIRAGVSTSERDVIVGGDGFDSYYRPYYATSPVVGGAQAADLRQGEAPVCQTVAALAAAAQQGHNFAADIRYVGSNWYEVKLYGNLTTQRVYFDGWTTGYDPVVQNGEFWMVLMQRARLQGLGLNPTKEYTRAEWDAWNVKTGGRLYSIGDAVYQFTGWASSYDAIGYANPQVFQTALARGDIFVAQSFAAAGAISSDGIIGNHAYAVVGVFLDAGVWKIRLYNPWGMDRENGSTMDSQDRYRTAANDGFITLTWTQFTKTTNFKGYFHAVKK